VSAAAGDPVGGPVPAELSDAELLKIRTEVQATAARDEFSRARACVAEEWTHDDWPSRVGSLQYYADALANELGRTLDREEEWIRAAGQQDGAKLAAIRAVLAAFDWEHDDRQYALEEIDRIAGDAS
jgi:hypothetical protein